MRVEDRRAQWQGPDPSTAGDGARWRQRVTALEMVEEVGCRVAGGVEGGGSELGLRPELRGVLERPRDMARAREGISGVDVGRAEHP